MDPHKVLNVPVNFTLAQLKDNYKRLALQLHPDKNLVSQEKAREVFQVLTDAYKHLLADYHARQDDRQFYELRESFKQVQASSVPSYTTTNTTANTTVNTTVNPKSEKFDAERFNKVFTENKIETPHERGYDDWIVRSSDAERAAREEEDRAKRRQAMIKYTDPQPFEVGARSKLEFVELGVAKVKDFGNNEYSSKSSIQYFDYRRAHTTARIIDPDAVPEKKVYKNVQELENERASVSHVMSEDDIARYEQYKAYLRQKEEERVRNLQAQDARVSQQYARVNQAMLGYVPGLAK